MILNIFEIIVKIAYRVIILNLMLSKKIKICCQISMFSLKYL